jgi:hypothetical protein
MFYVIHHHRTILVAIEKQVSFVKETILLFTFYMKPPTTG